MKRLLSILTITLLAGCATNPTVPENTITPILTHTGGQSLGDTTSLYWYTSQQNRPVKLAERVMAGDYGYYLSDYRWREGKLREIKREGKQLDEQTLKPFTLHVRYDTRGSAVFQRYNVGDEVIPLTNVELAQLREEAQRGIDAVRAQRRDDQSLIQGYWRQGTFYRCGDDKQLEVTFSPALPDYAQQQYDAMQQQGYMMVTGKVRRNALTASELLMLNNTQPACLGAPVLLN